MNSRVAPSSMSSVVAPDARILLVDDEAVNLRLLEKMLNASGFRNLVPIQNPHDVLLHYQEAPADLILLDLRMPGKDGFSVMEDLQRLNDPLLPPILVLTAYQGREHRLEALKGGARDFLTKPFDQGELVARVNNLLEMHLNYREVLRQHQLNKEENLYARRLYERMIHYGHQARDEVDTWTRPATLFCGDLVLSHRSDRGQLTVVMADAMGHGLSAAISLMPLAQSFHRSVSAGLETPDLLRDMNDSLCQALPDDRFVAACLVHICPDSREVQIWNGGMPDVLWFNGQGQRIGSARSGHMALGVLCGDRFDATVDWRPFTGDEILLMQSDGLAEARDREELFFRAAGVDRVLNQMNPGDRPLSTLKEALLAHIDGVEPEDDITLAQINLASLISSSAR